MEQVSDCCGAPDRPLPDWDSSYSDHGLCSECKDHCEYIDAEDDDVAEATNAQTN